jgi:hypothetical protein
MAQSTSFPLLAQIDYTIILKPNYIGEKCPAASYYLAGKNLQTVTWKTKNFKGIIKIQATLVENPTNDNDWVDVYKIDATQNILTQSSYANITGNFVWLRATIGLFTGGVVQSIKVSY